MNSPWQSAWVMSVWDTKKVVTLMSAVARSTMVSSVLIVDNRMLWQTLMIGTMAKPLPETKPKISIVPEVIVEIVAEAVAEEHPITDIAENGEEAIVATEMVNEATMATVVIARTTVTEATEENEEATVDVEVIVAATGLAVTVVDPAQTEVVCLPVIASSGVVAAVTVVELPHPVEVTAAMLPVLTDTIKAAISNESFLSHTPEKHEEALFENELS